MIIAWIVVGAAALLVGFMLGVVVGIDAERNRS